MDQEQSIKQKKIAFAQSEHVDGALAILREVAGIQKLVGANEFETLVNAVTLDVQSEVMKQFMLAIDNIKRGGLHTPA